MDFNAVPEKDSEEPYDRSKKMQKFIAAQQAVAKTGKTVLNNPELRKSQEVKSEAIVGEKDLHATPTKTRNADAVDGDLTEKSTPRPVPRIPPGLEDVSRKLDFGEVLSEPTEYDNNEALHEFFGVGTDEWFELKPVTLEERRKMLSVMQYSAHRMGKGAAFKYSAKDPDRLHSINEWLHEDTRGLKDARSRVDELAAEYSAKARRSETDSAEGNELSRNWDMHAGLLRGAGNVMATLTQYIAERENKAHDPAQDYFNRTKAPPDFAIDRREAGANQSLFETDKSGFYNPPSRIARDPRFRPQPKEAVAEDWTARFKMLTGSKWQAVERDHGH